MKVVALISWIVTALAGATLFSIWLARGGLRQRGPGASRFPRASQSWPPPASPAPNSRPSSTSPCP